MTLADELLRHAVSLLLSPDSQSTREVHLRRAISAAYYALFHRINADAVATIAPYVSVEINHRIQRWFNHGEMKKVAGRFSATQLGEPLVSLLGVAAPPDLQFVAGSFIRLQEARHSADYDLGFAITRDEALFYVQLAVRATSAWERVATSAEANIFILSLLLWKNWDRERL